MAKQNLILSYFHKSGTAHSIKDLEKALPSIASINGMQVKDYLQALTDDGKIRVEKIGSGNWYWSFLSEEKRSKEKILDGLRAEREKVATAVAELTTKLERARAARNNDNDDEQQEQQQQDDDGTEIGGDGHDRERLTRCQTALSDETQALQAELGRYRDSDPVALGRVTDETTFLRASAERYTDHIHALEQYYLELTAGDRHGLEQLRVMLYGDEYREGEGLAELDEGLEVVVGGVM